MSSAWWKYGRYLPRLVYKRGAFPLYVTHFVTTDCNAACGHCLLGSWQRPGDELTCSEIDRISRSMPDFLFCLLTGGEPFLRADLAEIVSIYTRNNNIVRCLIPTNGSLTEQIVLCAKTVLERHRSLSFGIDISIDAVGARHDQVRGLPGLAARATETCHRLQDLARCYENFDVAATITFSRNNQDEVLATYAYLTQDLGIKNIGVRFVRGRPRDPATRDIDLSKYIDLIRRVETELRARLAQGFSGFPLSGIITAEQLVAHETVVKTMKQGRWSFPCYAGILAGVIFSDGEVFPCELRQEGFGSLRGADYDFKKIWLSPQADRARRTIRRERCFCTHENFYATSLIFNPIQLTKVLAKWIAIQGNWPRW